MPPSLPKVKRPPVLGRRHGVGAGEHAAAGVLVAPVVDGVAAARYVEVPHDVAPRRALEPVLLPLRGAPGASGVAVDELRSGSEPPGDAEMEGVDPIHLDRERIPSARLNREVDGIGEAGRRRDLDREDHDDRLAGVAVMPVDELGIRLRSRGGDRETPCLARGG